MGLHRRSFLQTTSAGITALAGDSFEHSGTLVDVGGIKVGHFTHKRRPTGCTVCLFDDPAIAGVDVRGSAPGTRETDLLHPLNTVQAVNAIVLSGGSAFGLDTASGVMRYLDEKQVGFRMGSLVVPIVPAAIIFDLHIGDGTIRPDAQAGYEACAAAINNHVPEGNVGAGAGATVGKFFGPEHAMKGGVGSASIHIQGSDIVVGALTVVNAAGDVIDHRTGKILAGALTPDRKSLRNSLSAIVKGATIRPHSGTNSTIAIVGTNARLTKVEANKLAQMAHDGFARAINPVHTAMDGDTIFAAATGKARSEANISTLGATAAECVALAIQRAIKSASGIPGYPSHKDLFGA